MGQSLAQIYVHLVFGTKYRQKFIHKQIEKDFHSYLAGIFKNLDSPALEINSVADHVHILFCLSKTRTIAKIVEIVKKNTSKWIKERPGTDNSFSWQGGYGAFSVSSSKIEVVRKYIQKQKEHHKQVSFQEEVRVFMEKYGVIDYNEEFFWR